MRTERLRRAAAALAVLLAGTGCAASVAPPQWLPTAEQARREAWGGWIQLGVGGEDGRGAATKTVAGELLAVSDDSVYTLRDSTVTVTALADVREGRVESYDPETGALATMTVLGTLSTASHGFGLIVTAPLWIIVGTASTAGLSAGGKMQLDPALPPDTSVVAPGSPHADRASWRDLRLCARFPGGWPQGLDRASLRERPLHPPGSRRAADQVPSRPGTTRY